MRAASAFCSRPLVSVVVPLFNEQENLEELHRRLSAALAPLPYEHELVLVNDGSRDATPHMLDRLASIDPHLVAVHLSRNFGHQAAVSAGLAQARGNAVIIMDGDLQDPPEILGDFLERWREGFEVVYAVRTKRKESWLKRTGYFVFYRLLRAVSDIEIPLDSGDFCLMDRKVVDAVNALPEKSRFVRGLRTFVGYRQTGLRYERAARGAGQPKYTFRMLLRLALNGLLGFSGAPLTAIIYLGLLLGMGALAGAGWLIALACAQGAAPAGWAIAVVVALFVGALQLLSLGIVGEYVRRIFVEVKGRPEFIVRDIVRVDKEHAQKTHTKEKRPDRVMVASARLEYGPRRASARAK